MPHLSLFTSHFSPLTAARLHNPVLSLWLSVDPLSDKYPGVSPYVYCGNNPVVFEDFDGREKIISFSTNSGDQEKDRTNRNLASAAVLAYAEDPVIHLFAHGISHEGTCWGIRVCDACGESDLSNALNIGLFLYENSEVYKNNLSNGTTSILVLHSCKTGQDGSIAENISRELELLVIAPSDNLMVRTCDGMSYENGIANFGKWNLYYKGEKLDTFNELPIIYDTNKFISNYEEKYALSHPTTDAY